jgi:hypothetical protein
MMASVYSVVVPAPIGVVIGPFAARDRLDRLFGERCAVAPDDVATGFMGSGLARMAPSCRYPLILG